MSKLLDILKSADEITPIIEKDGTKIVSYEDAIILAEAEILEGESGLGTVTLNADGSIARSKVTIAAMNPVNFFGNRYRVKEIDSVKSVLQVVFARESDDCYRAIKEQKDGIIGVAVIDRKSVV